MLSLLVLVALSQVESPLWSLQWAAPEGCSGAMQLQQVVESRLRRTVFGSGATMFISGATKRAGAGWVASVTLADAKGAVLGTREVTTDEAQCSALDARLALVISLMIAPRAALGPEPVTAMPAPAPALPAAVQTRLPELPEEPKVHLHVEADDPAIRLIAIVRRGVNGPLGASFVARTVLCGPPCDREVPTSTPLYVSGLGIVPSHEIPLGLGASRVTLDVRAGHVRERTPAVLGLSFGVAGVVTSVTTLLLGVLLKSTSLLITSGVSGALGVGLTIAGAVGYEATATRVIVTAH